ncbi:MAG: FGGY-family carbohydrate kinase [Eubacteriaceae bacterium]|nr:FGGY-family carbohydrate kinase [Eubacteriaceae bacterium]
MEKFALTIDSGTKGVRGIIFDEKGHERAISSYYYTDYYVKSFGFYEASGEMFWKGLQIVTNELKRKNPEIFQHLIGVTVAAQRDTATIVDQSGNPIRDFISWMDRRSLDQPIKMAFFWRFLFFVSGNKKYTEMFNKGTHANWIKVNEPELWEKSKAYVLLSTYLITKLTGRMVDSKSDIAGHLPYNYKKKCWCTTNEIKKQIMPIESDKLCLLVDSCTVMGPITKAASKVTGLPIGLPVVGSGTDKGCETLGVGCMNACTASVSLGTQATVETTTKKYLELVPFYPSFAAVDPQAYNPEVTLYSGFWMIEWFIDFFEKAEAEEYRKQGKNILDFLNVQLEKIPVGSEGLVLQPYWGQETFKEEALGSIVGFTKDHTKYHVYRAVIEGIGYALKEGLERIEKKTKCKVNEIALSGGGSHSDQICQIMADIFGLKTYRVQTYETTGLGGALAIFTALGVYDNLQNAYKQMVHQSKQFEPDQDNYKIYNNIYSQVYKKAYKRYKPLYKKIRKLRK